jgi:hypothetical protein
MPTSSPLCRKFDTLFFELPDVGYGSITAVRSHSLGINMSGRALSRTDAMAKALLPDELWSLFADHLPGSSNEPLVGFIARRFRIRVRTPRGRSSNFSFACLDAHLLAGG